METKTILGEIVFFAQISEFHLQCGGTHRSIFLAVKFKNQSFDVKE